MSTPEFQLPTPKPSGCLGVGGWQMSLLWVFCLLPFTFLGAAGTTIDIASPMPAPEWATLQRRILADSVPAARAFFAKYYDERDYFRHVVRWVPTTARTMPSRTRPGGRS